MIIVKQIITRLPSLFTVGEASTETDDGHTSRPQLLVNPEVCLIDHVMTVAVFPY